MYNATEKTKAWQAKNPEKVQANKEKRKKIKESLKIEAFKAHKKTLFKTPMSAIKAFCRACRHGTSRRGKNYYNVPIFCNIKRCPLFCFRNGSPEDIRRGQNNKKGFMAMQKESNYGTQER